MKESLRHILIGVIILLACAVISVAGYVWAGWDLVDAIYFVVITVFGVGYEETRPIDTAVLKWFTIVVVVGGTSSVVYIITGVIQLMTSDEIRKSLGAYRMSKSIGKMKGHTIICGFGRMGQILARDLHTARADFVIIEQNAERVAECEAAGYKTLRGNASDEDLLIEAGVKQAGAVATVLPNDADNVFITLSARTLSKDLNIIARGEMPSTEVKLLRAGADHVILPPAIGGSRIAELILHPESSDVLDTVGHERTFSDELAKLGLTLSEVPVAPDSPAADMKLGDIIARGKDQHLIAAIRPSGRAPVYDPQPDSVLRAGDAVVVIGPRGDTPGLLPRAQG